LLPKRQRPRATGNALGTRNDLCHATSTESRLSRLQSFVHLQAPTLARPPGCTHRDSLAVGRPGRLHHAAPKAVTRLRCGIASCPTWATDTAGLSPAGSQPCRLLLPACGSRTSKADRRSTRLPLQPSRLCDTSMVGSHVFTIPATLDLAIARLVAARRAGPLRFPPRTLARASVHTLSGPLFIQAPRSPGGTGGFTSNVERNNFILRATSCRSNASAPHRRAAKPTVRVQGPG